MQSTEIWPASRLGRPRMLAVDREREYTETIDALRSELALYRELPVVPRQEYERVVGQRDAAVIAHAQHREALDAALQMQTGNERLIDVMRRRYGRECEQWRANHDQRKAERDAAVIERDTLAQRLLESQRDLDALTKLLADAQDKRSSVSLTRALALLTEGARLSAKDAGGPQEQDYRQRRAAFLAEHGRNPYALGER